MLYTRADLKLIQRGRARRHILLACVDDKIVGYGSCGWRSWPDKPLPPGWYLLGVRVQPPFQRSGIGLALTTARIAWMMQHTDTVWSTVEAHNQAAVALHRRAGFTTESRDRDVLLMKTTRTAGSGP